MTGSDAYARSLEFLEGLQRFGLRPGLDTTRELARRANIEFSGLRFVHVAGTNGKGSTCAFLDAMARASGRRVGLYTSPHLKSFRERIQCDRELVPEADVVRWVERLREASSGLPPDRQPSFFECVTVLALGWFAERRPDLIVWETGMGGRWDATNVVDPEVSIITNIGWDHMAWLGNTLPAIAAEKAGIIKPGRPILTAARDSGALDVIRDRARALGAPLHVVTDDGPEVAFVRERGISLVGEHQVLNAALAVAACDALAPAFPIPGAARSAGLRSARWPGRFQRLEKSGRTWVIDGAHNRPAFEVLAATLAREFPGERFGLVLGMLGDKDARAAVEWLGAGASRVRVVPVHSSRAGDPEVLVRLFREGSEARVEWMGALAEAIRDPGPERLWVVTGSLYLVGEALELLEAAGDGAANVSPASERRLNDWGTRP